MVDIYDMQDGTSHHRIRCIPLLVSLRGQCSVSLAWSEARCAFPSRNSSSCNARNIDFACLPVCPGPLLHCGQPGTAEQKNQVLTCSGFLALMPGWPHCVMICLRFLGNLRLNALMLALSLSLNDIHLGQQCDVIRRIFCMAAAV